jgi:hypothetical protein
MTGYVKYNQPYVTWTPPTWPLSREMAVGEEVSRLGKAHLRRKFCEGRWLPKADTPEIAASNTVHSDGANGFTVHPTQTTYFTGHAAPKKSRWLSWLAMVLFCAFFALLIGGGIAMLVSDWRIVIRATVTGLILSVITYLLYLASLGFAVARFNRWLTRCESQFKAIKATSGGVTHVVACTHCFQHLRFPARIGRLRIRCPSCRHAFLYDT